MWNISVLIYDQETLYSIQRHLSHFVPRHYKWNPLDCGFIDALGYMGNFIKCCHSVLYINWHNFSYKKWYSCIQNCKNNDQIIKDIMFIFPRNQYWAWLHSNHTNDWDDNLHLTMIFIIGRFNSLLQSRIWWSLKKCSLVNFEVSGLNRRQHVGTQEFYVSLCMLMVCCFNSLTPERFGYDYKNVIFSLALQTGIFRSSYENVIRWMPRDLTDDKSTLGQTMAWCRQATSHYLS